ncbi:Protein CBG27726 [Caenorhabditis briggsae]|uniref:Protein CBG27726 n=1 Tax=Caenorhabditis briggsae TaxID=6238 RepID=B6IJ24_CAEBR|nr:Protein CBG27726 [Caenorhabditis briggsae]CAS00004.1 Protein CBG27726 [Caenorhabditis briggsae]
MKKEEEEAHEGIVEEKIRKCGEIL